MSLANRIENIRKKPEHIRIRYVWAMVAVSMLLVLAIWFFSLKSGQEEVAPVAGGLDTSKITDQFNQGKASLQNASEGFQNALDNSATTNNSQ